MAATLATPRFAQVSSGLLAWTEILDFQPRLFARFVHYL
jgi:hypothetical protein